MSCKETGRYSKGDIPWNKDKKGIHLSPDSEFKGDGSCAGEKSKSWKGGLQTNDRDGQMIWTGTGSRTRVARFNYAKVHGEIPKGFVIYHIDGDKMNDDVTNLEAISRSELMVRNRKNRK